MQNIYDRCALKPQFFHHSLFPNNLSACTYFSSFQARDFCLVIVPEDRQVLHPEGRQRRLLHQNPLPSCHKCISTRHKTLWVHLHRIRLFLKCQIIFQVWSQGQDPLRYVRTSLMLPLHHLHTQPFQIV